MFWFIPMIASAVSGKMQENSQRANQTAQQNSFTTNNNMMRMPEADTRNANELYKALANETNPNTIGDNKPNNGILSNSINNTVHGNNTGQNSVLYNTIANETTPKNNNMSIGKPQANSFSSDTGSESGGGGGWASMAQSMMGLMASNKTPVASFTPQMAQPNYINTNSNNTAHNTNLSDITNHKLYDYLTR